MRTHLLTLFALMLVVGCGGQAADDAAADHTESSDGEAVAAVEALGENWERHYNMGAGHGGMAVSHLTDTAIHWTGSGDMLFGKEAIVARLEEQLEAGGSQLQLRLNLHSSLISIILSSIVFFWLVIKKTM